MAEEELPLISEDDENTASANLAISSPNPNRTFLKIIFSAGTIISTIGLYASTPIYASVMTQVADIYCQLLMTGFLCPILLLISWFIQQLLVTKERIYLITSTPFKILILCGFLSTIQNIVVVLATLPSRTPSYLIPLLSPAVIPFTAVVRFLILKKRLSIRQIICCVIVIAGLVISSIPTICSLPTREDDTQVDSKTGFSFLWPMLILIGQIPVAINYVLYENGAQRHTKELLLFYFWTQLFGFLWVIILFWMDIIPGFGQASSLTDFGHKIESSILCHFGSNWDSHKGCKKVPLMFVLNTLSYVGTDVFLICIMAVSEGSVFSTLVGCLSLPLSSFFWLLFKYDEKQLALLWEPVINYTALFPLAGLCLLLPSTIIYER